jgi:hypothetical protein
MHMSGEVDLGHEDDAERVGPRYPSGDLRVCVGAPDGTGSAAQHRRQRHTVTAHAGDRGQFGKRIHRDPPCLVVGQVQVEVRQLSPGGGIDHTRDHLRLEPLPGEVDVQPAERVPRRVLNGRARRQTAREPLGHGHEAVPKAVRITGCDLDRAAVDDQPVLLGREVGGERCRHDCLTLFDETCATSPPIEGGDRVPCGARGILATRQRRRPDSRKSRLVDHQLRGIGNQRQLGWLRRRAV